MEGSWTGPAHRETRAGLGRKGEGAALALYRSRGFEVVARNWRCRLGELDLVLRRGTTLVFCEVKARRGDRLGAPVEAVHPAKQRKLRMLAEAFLATGLAVPERVRFDVASVSVGGNGRCSVWLFEDAF